jgi:hypothetical protein
MVLDLLKADEGYMLSKGVDVSGRKMSRLTS